MARWTRWGEGGRGGRLVGCLGPRVGAPSSDGQQYDQPGALVDGPGSRRCNSHITQGFDVSPGSNLLSGCPTGNLEIGTYAFPWTMYVDVAGNYSTAEYTEVTWQPGTVSSGAYAWYSKFWIYPANNSALAYVYTGLECKGVRYAHQTIYPDHTFSFGSEDIVAEQYLYMSPSHSCSDQIPGTPEVVIYH